MTLLNSFWNLLRIRGCQIILAIIGLTDVTSRLSSCPGSYWELGQSLKLVVQGHTQPEWATARRTVKSELHSNQGRQLAWEGMEVTQGKGPCWGRNRIWILCTREYLSGRKRGKNAMNSSVCSCVSLMSGKPWLEDIIKIYGHSLSPSFLVTMSFIPEALFEKGTLLLLCDTGIVPTKSSFNIPSVHTREL